MKPTLVHIDLKGAPFKADPSCSFWPDFCGLVSRWGVSGLLVEWEDSVRIPVLASDPSPEFAYSRDEVGWLVDTARKNNLVVLILNSLRFRTKKSPSVSLELNLTALRKIHFYTSLPRCWCN